MDKFSEQHADRISGTLGCFDRVLFRGYLPNQPLVLGISERNHYRKLLEYGLLS
jgi:hypothetical protein